jgi:hypothetical protein
MGFNNYSNNSNNIFETRLNDKGRLIYEYNKECDKECDR